MKVNIKKFDVNMEIKNNGVEFAVADTDGKHLGDLVIQRKWVVWCPGKTSVKNGKRMNWKTFIKLMDGNV